MNFYIAKRKITAVVNCSVVKTKERQIKYMNLFFKDEYTIHKKWSFYIIAHITTVVWYIMHSCSVYKCSIQSPVEFTTPEKEIIVIIVFVICGLKNKRICMGKNSNNQVSIVKAFSVAVVLWVYLQ